MTLDPIHVENISRLAYGIGGDVDATDHDDLAERVWRDWLPALRRDGRAVIEAVGDHERRRATIDDVALADRPFETVHGLDSGTINPTTFKNGLVVDVAHAAMASSPTDLDLHRDRTIVATVHAGDSTAGFDSEWTRRDEGHTRQRVLHAPRVNRYAERVVHALALYLAEGTHALDHADAVEDLLVLDGPVYPKGLFTWADRDPELGALAREAKPRGVVEKYVRLVERFVERGVPLAGFVKNPASGVAVGALAAAGVESPWPDDAALFTRLLERRADGATGGRDRPDDEITFTTWFHSRGGADATVAADGDALGIDRELRGVVQHPDERHPVHRRVEVALEEPADRGAHQVADREHERGEHHDGDEHPEPDRLDGPDQRDVGDLGEQPVEDEQDDQNRHQHHQAAGGVPLPG